MNKPTKIAPPSSNPLFTGLLIFMLVFTMMTFFKINAPKPEIMDFKTFIGAVKEKRVEEILVKDSSTIIAKVKPIDSQKDKSREVYVTGDLKSDTYLNLLLENGLVPNYAPPEKESLLLAFLIGWFPVILLVGFFIYAMRRSSAGGGMGGITAFGKARTKGLSEGTPKVTFKDVAGVEEAKEELKEIVTFLSNPQKFTKIGAKIPKGALLIGPPGTGKTLLAKAVAGEAGVNFISIAGSDFVEMFVGVGASRVRDLFKQAKEQGPCIIFIDEIDAIGRARGGNGMSGGHDERDQTLNQLLVEMDGFDSQSGIIVLAATNRVDVLDTALVRPGRFDRRVVVPLPDINGRLKILNIHAATRSIDPAVNMIEIAKGTPGFSGAELANLINEAALFAASADKTTISQHDLEEARDKVMMGPQRKSMVITEEEKKTTAFHEAGHAIVSRKLKGMDPVHKVTIIPRGMALGVTQTLPQDDKLSLSKDRAKNMISMLMGGRVAEELTFDHFTTGASNDIERATQLARRMVCEWGMSDLGPINFTGNPQSLVPNGEFSEQTKQEVDLEIRKIINEAYKVTTKILTDHKEDLHKIATLLLEKETIDASDLDKILGS